MQDRLTLGRALVEGRLADFVAQAEAEGIGPADRGQFDAILGAVTAPQPEGQTSRSRGPGASRGR